MFGGLRRDGRLPRSARHLRGRWLDNRIEQDHRRIKRRTRPVPGLKRFATARRALAGIRSRGGAGEGQVRGGRAGDALAQRAFVLRLFGLAA